MTFNLTLLDLKGQTQGHGYFDSPYLTIYAILKGQTSRSRLLNKKSYILGC